MTEKTEKVHPNSAQNRATHVRCPQCGFDVLIHPAMTSARIRQLLAERTKIPVEKLTVTKDAGIALLASLDAFDRKLTEVGQKLANAEKQLEEAKAGASTESSTTTPDSSAHDE